MVWLLLYYTWLCVHKLSNFYYILKNIPYTRLYHTISLHCIWAISFFCKSHKSVEHLACRCEELQLYQHFQNQLKKSVKSCSALYSLTLNSISSWLAFIWQAYICDVLLCVVLYGVSCVFFYCITLFYIFTLCCLLLSCLFVLTYQGTTDVN